MIDPVAWEIRRQKEVRLQKWISDYIRADELVPLLGEGSAAIQWKGTSVCMDVYCRCGYHGHVDAEYAYYYRCGACGETFAVGHVVRLYRVDPTLLDTVSPASIVEGCDVEPTVDTRGDE